MLEFIILGFLTYGDLSGYDIKQCMRNSTAYFYDASFGSIYPMLKKLEEAGCVLVRESVEEGKYKKLYSLAPKGREKFLAWLAQPFSINLKSQEHLVKIFFMGFLPVERAAELIAGLVESIERSTQELEAVKQKIQGQADSFQLATVEYGLANNEFSAGWCREFLKRIQNDQI